MQDTPSHLKFTRDHEWLEIDGDTATIGITDHAQEALGDLVFIELPEEGTTVAAGDVLAVVESVKAASEVYTPLTGEIVAVNDDLANAPEVMNSAPYGDGWICKLRLHDESELDDCMSAADYDTYTAGMDE